MLKNQYFGTCSVQNPYWQHFGAQPHKHLCASKETYVCQKRPMCVNYVFQKRPIGSTFRLSCTNKKLQNHYRGYREYIAAQYLLCTRCNPRVRGRTAEYGALWRRDCAMFVGGCAMFVGHVGLPAAKEGVL